MDGMTQVAVGVGGVRPWSLWIVMIALASALIVGYQIISAARAISGDANLLAGQRWHRANRAIAQFGLLVVIASLPVCAILAAPMYILNMQTTFSGSYMEDMRPIGLLVLLPMSAAMMIPTPILGAFLVLSTPAAVFENINTGKGVSRSFQLSKYVRVFRTYLPLGIAMLLLAIGLIVLASYVAVPFWVKFTVGGWLFFMLTEPLHIALATTMFDAARQFEAAEQAARPMMYPYYYYYYWRT